jgi:hypothetical protein
MAQLASSLYKKFFEKKNCTPDVLSEVAKQFVSQVCHDLKDDNDYIEKYVSDAIKKAVEKRDFVNSVLEKMVEISKSIKKKDFCKKKCGIEDKQNPENITAETNTQEPAEGNENKIGGKNKTHRKKMRKTQNKKQKKKHTKKAYISHLRNLKGGGFPLFSSKTLDRIKNIPGAKSVANVGKRLQNVIPNLSSGAQKTLGLKNTEPESQSESQVPGYQNINAASIIPHATIYDPKTGLSNTYLDTQGTNIKTTENDDTTNEKSDEKSSEPSPVQSLTSGLTSLVSSKPSLDQFIDTAKISFSETLNKSMQNTESEIRNRILKSIHEVITNNESKITEPIINKIIEITQNIKVNEKEGSPNSFVFEYTPYQPNPPPA